MLRSTAPVLPILALFVCGQATAQWSTNAATNLAVADGASAQVQPKVAPTDDGGCYVSWYDSDPTGSPAFGYDVRLQRLDAGGVEQWPHGGVLIADRGFSSTQDYGLSVDLFGNAVLAFRDDRLGGVQITAAMVYPDGTMPWGPGGVQLTNTTDFLSNPKVCGTSNGFVTVAWGQNSDLHLQRLDLTGAPQWATDVVLTIAGSNLGVADLHGANNDAVIVGMVKYGSFTAPRHLYAQKLDAAGGLLWGVGHLPVFDGGSLQIGNFPPFVPDGSGGAVFGWYSSTPTLECRAQHVDANGTELFPHDGVAAATTANDRVTPSVAFDPVSQTTLLAYAEEIIGSDRVGAQAFDVLGTPLWGAGGAVITPFSANDVTDVDAVSLDGELRVFWIEAPAFGQAQLYGVGLDAAGATVVPQFAVGSTPSGKGRAAAAASSFGFAMLAWQDDAVGDDDVLVQNALSDGTLGGVATATLRNGSGVNPVCFTTGQRPAIGAVWHGDVGHAPTAALTVVLMSLAAEPGTPVPGIGELLVSLPIGYMTVQSSAGSSDVHTLSLPANTALVGTFVAAQAAVLDGATIQACNAIDLVVGL